MYHYKLRNLNKICFKHNSFFVVVFALLQWGLVSLVLVSSPSSSAAIAAISDSSPADSLTGAVSEIISFNFSSLLLVNALRHELGVSSSFHKNPSQSLGRQRSAASQLKEIRRIFVNKLKGRSKKDSTSEETLTDSPLLAYESANHGPTKLFSPRGEKIRHSSTWTYESSTSTWTLVLHTPL